MNTQALIHQTFLDAIEKRVFSAAGILVAGPEHILFENTYGTIVADGPIVSPRTIFDLASLTKPLATTLMIMLAISRGDLSLEGSLERFFPDSVIPAEKRGIRIVQLLSHCSGLPSYRPFFEQLITVTPQERSQALLREILNIPLAYDTGESCRYSDLGFMLLGAILQQTYGCPLHVLFERSLQALAQGHAMRLPCGGKRHYPASVPVSWPLEKNEIGFIPLECGSDPTQRPRHLCETNGIFAATEFCPWRHRLLQGEVHDENAYVLGGVAPHAGLFGTARGVYSILSLLWGIHQGTHCTPELDSNLLRIFWTRSLSVPDSTWALGFDSPSPIGSSAGRRFSRNSIGHLGYTGTSFWLDLDQQILIILLTNRVYPTRANEGIKTFRPIIHDIIMEGINDLRSC